MRYSVVLSVKSILGKYIFSYFDQYFTSNKQNILWNVKNINSIQKYHFHVFSSTFVIVIMQ